MRTLIFDTETTGLADFKRPNDWKRQPALVQLGAVLANEAEVLSKISLIVNPGTIIPVQAADVHGITSAKAQAFGVPPVVAIGLFNNLLRLADRVVGHNIDFDLIVMHAAYARLGRPISLLDKNHLPHICTMKSATPAINLPPTAKMKRAGFNKPKPPKLEEAIKFFFDEKLEGAHDALIDVFATLRVLRELERRGVELIGGER